MNFVCCFGALRVNYFFSVSGRALEELAREKPQMKIVESHTHGFIKTLESVEGGLMKQINYLTQVSTGTFVIDITQT